MEPDYRTIVGREFRKKTEALEESGRVLPAHDRAYRENRQHQNKPKRIKQAVEEVHRNLKLDKGRKTTELQIYHIRILGSAGSVDHRLTVDRACLDHIRRSLDHSVLIQRLGRSYTACGNYSLRRNVCR